MAEPRPPSETRTAGFPARATHLGAVAEINRSELVGVSVRNVLAESWSGLVRTRENG
jgi:hypothetical protein